MANPRQRRKSRSSSYRPVKQSRHANKLLRKQPPIHGPKFLQDAWDKRKTVRQNYAALGLMHTLSPCDSGGSERLQKGSSEPLAGEAPNTNAGDSKSGKATDFGKIIRDDEGNVMRIEMDNKNVMNINKDSTFKEDVHAEKNNEAFDEMGIHDAEASKWLLQNNRTSGADADNEQNEAVHGDVSRALNEISAQSSTRTRPERMASAGEGKYLRELVKAHGRDLEGMTRDRKRNVNQYTSGQLRRAIERAGGFEALGND